MDEPGILSDESLNLGKVTSVYELEKDGKTIKTDANLKSDESEAQEELNSFTVGDNTLHQEKKPTSEISIDGGYASSSDEERSALLDLTCRKPKVADEEKKYIEENRVLKEIIEKYHFDDVPAELKKIVLGANKGLPNDYSVPIDSKPDWLDMEKFKKGQEFARKYLLGVNTSQMMALFVLFALPDGLETLIFSGNSSTPFTSFRRYLSTVLRVTSWYDHDIWSKGNPGYQNLKAVRAMHLNISKKINSTPHDVLKDQVTLAESSSKPPIWATELTNIVQQDFQSGCPFKAVKQIHSTVPGKIFVNQLDMSTTQFGFVGLIIAYPEKFGAASAKREELEGFIHLWRCIGYLLGMEDKYNFCEGTLDEVTERCRSFVEHWAKPNFQTVTADWEHMSRCVAEGMSNSTAAPPMSFEVSIMYLCWVMDVQAPRLYASLSWTERFQFYMLKFMMTYAVRIPRVLPMLNEVIRRELVKSSTMSSEEWKKLENKKYDYQMNNKNEKYAKQKKKQNLASYGKGISVLALVYVIRLLL